MGVAMRGGGEGERDERCLCQPCELMLAGARAMRRAPLAVLGIVDAVRGDRERGGRSDGEGGGGEQLEEREGGRALGQRGSVLNC